LHPRAPPRSLPSSRRRRSPIWSAPPPECLLLCQRLLTHLRTLFPPFLCTFPPASEREHVPSCVPFRTYSFSTFSEHIPCLACRTSCARSQVNTHTPFLHSTSTRCCPPSCVVWTAATSSCRTGGWHVLPRLSHPATSPSQLGGHQPRQPGQEGRQSRRTKSITCM
jgi:hypothetical protein